MWHDHNEKGKKINNGRNKNNQNEERISWFVEKENYKDLAILEADAIKQKMKGKKL